MGGRFYVNALARRVFMVGKPSWMAGRPQALAQLSSGRIYKQCMARTSQQVALSSPVSSPSLSSHVSALQALSFAVALAN